MVFSSLDRSHPEIKYHTTNYSTGLESLSELDCEGLVEEYMWGKPLVSMSIVAKRNGVWLKRPIFQISD